MDTEPLVRRTADGWERILDATDRRQTVYWRRPLPDGSWLSVGRRENRWRWRHLRHVAKFAPHEIAGSNGKTWPDAITARRKANAYLAGLKPPARQP